MNTLYTHNPTLAQEWHPTKNGILTPKDVMPCSGKRVWWQCKKGHEWYVTINNRSFGYKCPYCASRIVCKDNCLQTKNPKLAKEWHPTKNGSLTPKNVVAGSHLKVWWLCKNGHSWQAVISSRMKGHGCLYCLKRKALPEYNLKVINPKVARQWHPTKNGTLKPKDMTPGSNKKVWWVCKKGHEWQAVISSRNSGSGCPYCSNKLVCKDNCLQTVNTKVAREWHPTKNGNLTPRDVTPGSDKKVWWKCTEGHEWKAWVYKRKDRGCHECHLEWMRKKRKDKKKIAIIKRGC